MKGSRTPRSRRIRVDGCRGSGCCPVLYVDKDMIRISVPVDETTVKRGRMIVQVHPEVVERAVEIHKKLKGNG